MTDQRLLYKLKRVQDQLLDQLHQAGAIIINLENSLEIQMSVACGWAFDEGRGVPHLTREEIDEFYQQQYELAQANARQPSRIVTGL